VPVGDVNSSARGSGARFNDGKPELHLIPLNITACLFALVQHTDYRAPSSHPANRVQQALFHLSLWQDDQATMHLYDALMCLDDPLRQAADVFSYGAKKYAAWNWCKGMAWSIPVSCALRHALAVIEGEIDDPESQHSHEGHLACNLIMLIHFDRTFPEGNDIAGVLNFQ